MKKLFLLLPLALAGCSTQPAGEYQQQVARAFIDYKDLPLTQGKEFEVLEQNVSDDEALSNGDFTESRYFISYWPSPECVEGYTVFEKCELLGCRYKFEWVEGVCD